MTRARAHKSSATTPQKRTKPPPTSSKVDDVRSGAPPPQDNNPTSEMRSTGPKKRARPEGNVNTGDPPRKKGKRANVSTRISHRYVYHVHLYVSSLTEHRISAFVNLDMSTPVSVRGDRGAVGVHRIGCV